MSDAGGPTGRPGRDTDEDATRRVEDRRSGPDASPQDDERRSGGERRIQQGGGPGGEGAGDDSGEDPTARVPTGPRPGARRLAGRYELRGTLGQGGMADVQRARDLQLDRDVAIKILHARYADDVEFLGRFQREARAAANLNHPNIVAVYDYGEDDGRPYIVMELVEGRSLKDVIRSERVTPEAAIDLIGDTAMALHYAHERGLVHRDVKPANILFSNSGTVKVTDFGIARAVGAETVTQTAAVFGTAAYMAPEQARSEEVDRRTDVYALGCVLYELLSGRQPFSADSPVALAHKHISEMPAPPSSIDPEISGDLDSIVMKAMAKNPDQRYQTASELGADLRRAREGAPVAAASWAASTQMLGAQPEPTRVTEPAYDYEPGYDYERQPRRLRRGLGYAALTVAVVAAVVLIGWLLSTLVSQQTPELVAVPDVSGLTGPEATAILDENGLEPREGDERASSEFEEGQVIETDPPAGQEVEEGSVVTYFTSTGPEQVAVPEVVGLAEDDARAALGEAGLEVGERSEETSEDVEEGAVIRSSPAVGAEVDVGTAVDLVISTGTDAFAMPDVVELPRNRAVRELENACDDPPCLSVQVSEEFSDDVAEGLVMSQSPEAGTEVQPGSSVVIVVSQGPEPVPTTEPPPPPTEEPTAEPSPEPSPEPEPEPEQS
jgi:eukaryotic-like serine/threonine-protein kinase